MHSKAELSWQSSQASCTNKTHTVQPGNSAVHPLNPPALATVCNRKGSLHGVSGGSSTCLPLTAVGTVHGKISRNTTDANDLHLLLIKIFEGHRTLIK